jgi:hypothetical protein
MMSGSRRIRATRRTEAVVMSDAIEGIIHGKVIELTADPGLGDGLRVEVCVRPLPPPAGAEAILSTAGALADLPQEAWDDLDIILRERRGVRKHWEDAE